MYNKYGNDILFNVIFGNSGSGGGGGDNPFVPPTGYKQVGVVDGYPVPRINLRSACVNDLGFPFSLGIDDDTVQAGDKILVVGQATDDNTPFAVWGTVASTRTAGNYYIARLTVEGSAIRTDAAYVVDITTNGGTLVFGTTKVNVNVPNPSSGSLEITENGTYDVTAKASAVVNVENSYTASDEGKVVDNGALVSQTSQNISSNGTYDTTTKNEVVVNVPSSGGVSEKWAKLHTTNNGSAIGSIEITDADVPSGWTLSTGDYAFAGNNMLKSISSSDNERVGDYAFQRARYLQAVYFPNLKIIGDSAFQVAGDLATWNCDLNESIKKVTSVGSNAFANSNISGDLVFPAHALSIKSSAFTSAAKITGLKFPTLTASIGGYAMRYCYGLKHFEAPLASGTIGNNAFDGCRELEYAIFGGITEIKYSAFNGCSSLVYIVLGGTSVCTLDQTSAFNNCTALESIYVPDALVENYKTATNWSTFASKIKPVSEMPTV